MRRMTMIRRSSAGACLLAAACPAGQNGGLHRGDAVESWRSSSSGCASLSACHWSWRTGVFGVLDFGRQGDLDTISVVFGLLFHRPAKRSAVQWAQSIENRQGQSSIRWARHRAHPCFR
jgi:hypothetical protein